MEGSGARADGVKVDRRGIWKQTYFAVADHQGWGLEQCDGTGGEGGDPQGGRMRSQRLDRMVPDAQQFQHRMKGMELQQRKNGRELAEAGPHGTGRPAVQQ